MITDLRKESGEPKPCVIHGETVQLVETNKYLGTVFNSQLKVNINSQLVSVDNKEFT